MDSYRIASFWNGDMRSILLIFYREITNFFRDRQTIIYSIVFPILLYPVIFWGMNQILILQRGHLETTPYRIGIHGRLPEELAFIMLDSDLQLDFITVDRKEFSQEKELKNLKLDAALSISGCPSDYDFNLFFTSAQDRSDTLKTYITGFLNEFRLTHIQKGFEEIGLSSPEVNIMQIDVSSAREKAEFILGILLPMLIIIITLMGGLYPSIEVIVAERERATLETTMLLPVSVLSLILGKFAAVVFMSIFAVVLNIASILLTLKHTLLMNSGLGDIQLKIPLSSLPLILIGTLIIATIFSAVMILAASFAKSFKEGQSFVTPIYILGIQPAVISAIPGVPFNSYTALIPISNMSLMFREAIRGNFDLIPISITLAELSFLCIIILILAKSVLSVEGFMFNTMKPKMLWQLIKRSRFNHDRS